MLRVMAIGDDGREQLRIWRGLATAPSVLLANNHALPLLREIDIGRFTVGVFPLVSQNLGQAYLSWAQSSVGDILDMILQALEASKSISARKLHPFMKSTRAWLISTVRESRIGSVILHYIAPAPHGLFRTLSRTISWYSFSQNP